MDHKNSNSHNVVVIGGANMDICGTPTNYLISGDSNPGKINICPGGVGRNIVENIARMGLGCTFLSVVGNDLNGISILSNGKNAGINMSAVLKVDEAPTSTYLSVLDGNGDLSVGLNDMSAMEYLTPDYLEKHQHIIGNAAAIIMDTNVSGDVFEYVTGAFKEINLIVDAVSTAKAKKIKPFLKSIDTLKVNKIEAQAISGLSTKNNAEIADWLHGQGVKEIYLTLGADGVFYSGPSDQGSQKISHTAHPVNATGAGDAFVAGVVYGQLENWAMDKISKFAICAADMTAMHNQTVNPDISIEKINELMEKQYGSE